MTFRAFLLTWEGVPIRSNWPSHNASSLLFSCFQIPAKEDPPREWRGFSSVLMQLIVILPTSAEIVRRILVHYSLRLGTGCNSCE